MIIFFNDKILNMDVFCKVWMVILSCTVSTNGIYGLVLNISETEPNGTIIWNNTAQTNCTWINAEPSKIQEYFRFTASWSQLVLDKPLDLEVLKDHTNTLAVSLSLSCNMISTKITINITPENEFVPEFLNGPFTTSVHEGTKNGASVYSLDGRVRDRDAFKYNSVSYSVIPFQIEQYDGRTYFSLDNETGNVTTKLDIDYEKLDRSWCILRVVAKDDGGFTAEATLNITIVDVDDMPPEFVSRDNCYRKCTPIESYSKVIDIHTEGPLSELQPEEVYARDGDRGVKAQINYTFYNDSSNELIDNLAIDEITGVIEVLAPFVNVIKDLLMTLPEPFIVELIIIATENSNSSRSTNASFSLVVYRVLPHSTSPLPTTVPVVSTNTLSNDDDNSSLLLIEIIVPCTLVVLLVAVIIVILLKKRQKMKEMKYNVKETDKRASKSGGDMMDSLPATMATPYDLVGAYANFNIGSYENHVFEEGNDTSEVPLGSAAEEYANDMSNSYDGLYAKVKKKPPRVMKMRAVDIVEADGGEEDFGRKGSYDVKGAAVRPGDTEVVMDDNESVGTISDNTDVIPDNVNQLDKDDSNSN